MPQRKKQPNKSPAEHGTARRPGKMHLFELSDREDELLRLGVKFGVEETIAAFRELHTGRASHALEDGAMEMLRQRGIPRA